MRTRLDYGDPVVCQARRVHGAWIDHPGVAADEHPRPVVRARIAGSQQIHLVVRHRRVLHDREVTAEEGLIRRALVVHALDNLFL